MKFASLLLLTLLLPSCHDTYSVVPATDARIIVYVHWEEQPLAARTIELVQTGETHTTGPDGTITFEVTAGVYVIRAYGINRPGPAPRSIDFNVEVHGGETVTLDIVDCLPCV